jgi:hypothetical protein
MELINILISLVLIYALLSILVSVLVEAWNHYKKTRGAILKEAIEQMLDDPENMPFGTLLLEHPMVAVMGNKKTKRPPQYLDKSVFAEAFIDVVANRAKDTVEVKEVHQEDDTIQAVETVLEVDSMSTLDRFGLSVEQLNPSGFQKMLKSLYSKSGPDIDKLKGQLESWYENYMDRVSGWYKTRNRKKTRIVALLIVLALNVDSIHMFKVISYDKNLRDNLVTYAEQVVLEYDKLNDEQKEDRRALQEVATAPAEIAAEAKSDTLARLMADARIILDVAEKLEFPVGYAQDRAPLSWPLFQKVIGLFGTSKSDSTANADFAHGATGKAPKHGENATTSELENTPVVKYIQGRDQGKPYYYLVYFFGLIISVFTLSFGAPFWFDTLSRLVSIRQAGKKPPETGK